MDSKFSILATFFCLWLTSYIDFSIQYYIAIGLVMSLGILHGSNDISLLGKLKNASTTSKMLYFLATYILVVIVAGICFYFLPSLALICFIVFSGYHFGEQHYHDKIKKSKFLTLLFYTCYGLFVLFLIFNLNILETKEIVFAIVNQNIPVEVFKYGLYSLTIIMILLYIYAYQTKKLSFSELFYEIVLLGIFAIVFQVSNLIWSFTIYFIFWHSIPSMLEQMKFLYGEKSWKSFISYIKNSLLTWLVSIIAMVILLYLARGNESFFLPLLFSFLGAITFAHAFIVSKIFKS